MAIRVEANTDLRTSVGTTLSHLIPGDDVHVIWVKGDADLYLVMDNAIADGAAIGGTRGFRIAANESWPIEVGPVRPLIAAVTGTVALTLLGRTL